MNVLYVEDEYVVCTAMQNIWNILKRSEKLFVAHKYEQAMQYFQENDFALAIVDLSLPGKTGDELIRDMKKIKDIKIVALSNYSKESNPATDLVEEHYNKPFYLKDVKSILEKHLDA